MPFQVALVFTVSANQSLPWPGWVSSTTDDEDYSGRESRWRDTESPVTMDRRRKSTSVPHKIVSRPPPGSPWAEVPRGSSVSLVLRLGLVRAQTVFTCACSNVSGCSPSATFGHLDACVATGRLLTGFCRCHKCGLTTLIDGLSRAQVRRGAEASCAAVGAANRRSTSM